MNGKIYRVRYEAICWVNLVSNLGLIILLIVPRDFVNFQDCSAFQNRLPDERHLALRGDLRVPSTGSLMSSGNQNGPDGVRPPESP
jgi:hypothetical protein